MLQHEGKHFMWQVRLLLLLVLLLSLPLLLLGLQAHKQRGKAKHTGLLATRS
jgi:uncharacterized iron-regulated membrane protein